tara:strand:+ start:8407 stop:9669 length:1263 start_codon:yes stop_codon:yes gene_type:complete
MALAGRNEQEAVAALVAALPHPDTIASPYALYDELRPYAPVQGYRDYPPGTIPGVDEAVNAWVLLDYAHVAAASRDHRIFSSRDDLQESSSAPTLMLVNHDNPEHDRLRNIVNLAFSRPRIEALDPWVREIVDGMVKAVCEGRMEAMATLSSVIPARVMAGLLGLDDAVFDRFRGWGTAFMLSADMTPAERERSNGELFGYFTEIVTALDTRINNNEDVPDGLIAALLRAKTPEGRLSLGEVIRFCITLVVAGAETTTFLLGNLLHNLATMPDVRARLTDDRATVGAFIDESLRHSGPPQRLFRMVTEDVVVGGRMLKTGDWVALFYAAANHDATVFPDPHRFDMDRRNLNKQLTFGVGIHHCLGSALARMEARSLINAALDHWSDIALAEAPVPQRASLLNHGIDKLFLTIKKSKEAMR